MERVSILEASRRLNMPQATIRRYIRDGKLNAVREQGPRGNIWMVELPEDGWLDSEKEAYLRLAEGLSPWWWNNAERSGPVHYVEDIGIEEIIPQFLCGLVSENIWTATGHTEEQRCPACLQIAISRELPLTASQ